MRRRAELTYTQAVQKASDWCISISMAESSQEFIILELNISLQRRHRAHLFKISASGNVFAYLVFRSSNGFREGKERQGQVHEAIFVGLQLLVSFDNLEELQAHQADNCSCGSGDSRDDLTSYQFALFGD